MTSITSDTARSLLRHRPFLFYFIGRVFSSSATQIVAVAVGWQVYALTGSALDLGLVGLAQFLPMLLLVFVAGHAADRYDRRRVLQVCQSGSALVALFLAFGSFGNWLTVPEIFGAVCLFGFFSAFENPARGALLPAVAPVGQLQRAVAFATGAMQMASISAPALGGFVYAVAPGAPYVVVALILLSAILCNGAITLERPVVTKAPASLEGLFDGVKFVRDNPAILGTISLDLFAVLFGGATALLPIYARDILHTGPWGLGVLRGAPAIGALIMAAYLTHHPLKRRVGIRMFQAVIGFGLATIVFALSHTLWLSILALAAAGAADTVSMVIRISLVQIATPDSMRGRVGAVNFLFINASNQLGEFESGTLAALIGAMPAVLLGGIGSIGIALLWMRLFPTLRDVERLE
jgi:MFS family permease